MTKFFMFFFSKSPQREIESMQLYTPILYNIMSRAGLTYKLNWFKSQALYFFGHENLLVYILIDLNTIERSLTYTRRKGFKTMFVFNDFSNSSENRSFWIFFEN